MKIAEEFYYTIEKKILRNLKNILILLKVFLKFQIKNQKGKIEKEKMEEEASTQKNL